MGIGPWTLGARVVTVEAMRATMFEGQKMRKPSRAEREDSLYEPQGGGRERGNYPGSVRKRSLYTMTSMRIPAWSRLDTAR